MNGTLVAFLNGLVDTLSQLDRIEAKIDEVITQGNNMAHTADELNAKLDELGAAEVAYIAQRDAIDVDLRNQITTLTAGNTTLQASIDGAFDKAQADIAALTPPTPPVADVPAA